MPAMPHMASGGIRARDTRPPCAGGLPRAARGRRSRAPAPPCRCVNARVWRNQSARRRKSGGSIPSGMQHRLAEGGGRPQRRERQVDDPHRLTEARRHPAHQLVERHVPVVADQVRLAHGLRVLRGQLERVDEVVDVAGMVEGLAVAEHQEAAALDGAEEHQEAAGVARPVDAHRADHARLEAAAGNLPERLLALVLRLLVVVLGRDRRVLVAGRARRRARARPASSSTRAGAPGAGGRPRRRSACPGS